jgi:hypothetical protein
LLVRLFLYFPPDCAVLSKGPESAALQEARPACRNSTDEAMEKLAEAAL